MYETFYNPNFVVKYWNIQNELLQNILIKENNLLKEKVLEKVNLEKVLEKEDLEKVLEKVLEKEKEEKEEKEELDEEYNKEKVLEKEELDEEYNKEEVMIICNKLYQDELCSVFCIDNIYDDKLNIHINCIYEILIKYNEFNNFFKEVKHIIITQNADLDEVDKAYIIKDNEYFCYLLFSYDLFHLFHIVICDVLLNNVINVEMLKNMKISLENIIANEWI
jgi:actin-related protein